MLESASAATDLDLISYLRSIPDARMRRGVRIPAWYLLLVAVLGILSGCQSLRDLERFAIRHHAVLTEALGIELDPFEHGQQMHRIAGLVAYTDRHDHLVIAIVRRLAVVSLDSAATAFEDLTVGVSEIALGAGFGVAGRVARECVGWHRQ